MRKVTWLILGLIALSSGAISLFVGWKFAGALLVVAGAVLVGLGLPPTDSDTSGGSGASDAN